MAWSARFALVLITAVIRSVIYCDVLVYNKDYPLGIEEEFRDMPARFGPALPPEGMKALVVLGDPQDGCDQNTLKKPPVLPNFTSNWVVLLARYNCNFERKIRSAQFAGYDGVIVHNINSSDLEIMSANSALGIMIPSVFIGAQSGNVIQNHFLYDSGYFVVINGDLPFNINSHLFIPFAIVVSLCFIVLIVFLIVKCVRAQRRTRRHRLPYSSLKKIPTCKFAKGDPYDTCAICLDDYVEGDKLRVLPCAHAYHCKCIDPWLTKNRRVCPVCKRLVFANGERQHRRNTSSSRTRDSHSDSDLTDDDRAPLVESRSEQRNTQGGTFNNQSENQTIAAFRPDFARSNRVTVQQEPTQSRATHGGSWPETLAARDMSRGGPFLTGVLNLRGDRFTQPMPSVEEASYNDRQNLYSTSSTSSKRTDNREETEGRSSNRRASSEGTPKRSKKSSRNLLRKKRLGSHSTQKTSESEPSEAAQPTEQNAQPPSVSAEDIESGRIGVAALPNVHIEERNQGSDYIV